MPEAILRPMAYHVVRYTPNLVRDEWINIGVLLFDPASGRVVRRLMDEPAELADRALDRVGIATASRRISCRFYRSAQ